MPIFAFNYCWREPSIVFEIFQEVNGAVITFLQQFVEFAKLHGPVVLHRHCQIKTVLCDLGLFQSVHAGYTAKSFSIWVSWMDDCLTMQDDFESPWWRECALHLRRGSSDLVAATNPISYRQSFSVNYRRPIRKRVGCVDWKENVIAYRADVRSKDSTCTHRRHSCHLKSKYV